MDFLLFLGELFASLWQFFVDVFTSRSFWKAIGVAVVLYVLAIAVFFWLSGRKELDDWFSVLPKESQSDGSAKKKPKEKGMFGEIGGLDKDDFKGVLPGPNEPLRYDKEGNIDTLGSPTEKKED